uniref:Uncharacterized protein n=1 Tax=Peronospora matthiolae TaxID=2874970 RepID=A0AAV1UG29_9STRA
MLIAGDDRRLFAEEKLAERGFNKEFQQLMGYMGKG